MSLAIDSLVTDLMFQAGDALDPEALVEVLGGQEELATKQVVDPDMQDPRFEMEVSPSIPFRRRGERRLMIIDDTVAPMRSNPREDIIIPLDLRDAKEKLIAACAATPIRLGRLFALGSWGDAVWVVQSYTDLRALCLMSWAINPNLDVDGRQRATPLGKHEFEEKLLAYDKRLDELDENQIKDCITGANIEERDHLIIVDVLEEDGTWNPQRSLELEHQIAALDKFSVIPGARIPVTNNKQKEEVSPQETPLQHLAPSEVTTAAEQPIREEVQIQENKESSKEKLIPLQYFQRPDKPLIYIPQERFSLDIAALLGKGDWHSIFDPADPLESSDKNKIIEHGADFITNIDFLSEVFIDGIPLSKPHFEAHATKDSSGNRSLAIHFPRFGPATLFVKANGARFVCSTLTEIENIVHSIS